MLFLRRDIFMAVYAYTVAFHVPDLKYREKGEKYRALRQVGKARRLVKRYEFLISPHECRLAICRG